MNGSLERQLIELEAETSRLRAALQTEVKVRQFLEERTRRMARLMDSTEEALILCDSEARILSWNAGAARMYGWSSDDVLGKPLLEVVCAAYEEGGNPMDFLQKNQGYGAEETHFHQSGAPITVQTRWSFLGGGKGEELGILVVTSDVSSQKRWERHFLRMQRVDTMGMLSSGIAHDLNNVLTPILMASQSLRGEIRSPEHRELLDSIECSAQRGAEMVHHILCFTRGKDSERIPFQLPSLLQDVRKLVGDTFPKNIKISTRFGKNLLPVIGNKTQICQAIMNLCLNSRDAMPRGGALRIEAQPIRMESSGLAAIPGSIPGDYIQVKVGDTGAGISDEVLAKVFDPFFTTKEPGKGTGLGLFTVFYIIKQHGGFVNVVTQLRQGTEFQVYLPVIPGGPAMPRPAKSRSPLFKGEGKWILVVDDEGVIREVTRKILIRYGYQIITASNGLEALERFKENQHRIDAVITDYAMPRMDGSETIRALLKLNPKLKVIISSGSLTNSWVLPETEQGIIPVLGKPFTTEKLLETLQLLFSGANR